ncbi:hypothetical protein BGZ65_005725, partial [Modicella reniformis]
MPLDTISTHSPNRSRSSSDSSFILIDDEDSDSLHSIASQEEDPAIFLGIRDSDPEEDSMHDNGSDSSGDDTNEDELVSDLEDNADDEDDEDDEDDADTYSLNASDHDFDRLSLGSISHDDSDQDDILSIASSADFGLDSDPTPAESTSPALPSIPLTPPPPIPSSSSSSFPSSETTSQRRRNRKTSHEDKDPNSSSLPSCLPPTVAEHIFSFFDHYTLHSTLTVSKGWFSFAARQLYRNPFNSDHDQLMVNDTLTTRILLTPAQERLLVRLLLRSIQCPSEPGEEVVLVCEEVDDVVGSCRVVDKDGIEIRTTTNYMRFLEVFDWAPWNRYMNFWETCQVKQFVMSEGLQAVVDVACEGETEDDQDCSLIVQEMLRVAMQSKRVASPFRFSYNTLLDWFIENPRAHTVVMHLDMKFSSQTA